MDERLIIVVPGFASGEKEECLKRLTEGLDRFATLQGSFLRPLVSPGTGNQKSYEYERSNGNKSSIHFREIYWSDLTPPLSEKNPIKKFLIGCSILIFWLSSRRVFNVAWLNRYMFASSAFSILVLLFWYYGAVVAALSVIGTTDEAKIFFSILPEFVKNLLQGLEPKLADWPVWIIASAIMAFIPVNLIVDVAHSTMRYFRNDDDLARKLQARIAKAINDAKGNNFTGIVVFAHSFGAVAAAEALATSDSNLPIHLVTTGSPLAISCARSPDLQKAVKDVLKNPSIIRWSDFYSNDDWMCCAPPIKGNFQNFETTKLEFQTGFFQKFTGKSHLTYFNCNVIYQHLIE